jgi:hypothetical protein
MKSPTQQLQTPAAAAPAATAPTATAPATAPAATALAATAPAATAPAATAPVATTPVANAPAATAFAAIKKFMSPTYELLPLQFPTSHLSKSYRNVPQQWLYLLPHQYLQPPSRYLSSKT